MARRSAPRTRLASGLPILTVAVGPASGSSPSQELTAFTGVSCRFHFTGGDTLSFQTTARSAEALYIDELASDVWLFGPVEQRYRIINVGQSWVESGESTVDVQAVNYKKLLGSRHVGPGGLTYTQMDQGDIVWNFIVHTQARTGGNWGVTKGVSTTGVLRDRTYLEGDNLGKIADELQNVIDGLWWDIDINKVYSAAKPSSFATLLNPIQLGINARTMQRVSAADRFANVAYGTGSDTTTPVWAQTATLASDPRGRWEAAHGWTTVILQATLQQHTDGALLDTSAPLTAWTVVMEPDRWDIDSLMMPGDFVVLVRPPIIGEPGVAERVVCQVMELGLDINSTGAVGLSLALNETRRTVPA
jgi:hypothetical protein